MTDWIGKVVDVLAPTRPPEIVTATPATPQQAYEAKVGEMNKNNPHFQNVNYPVTKEPIGGK